MLGLTAPFVGLGLPPRAQPAPGGAPPPPQPQLVRVKVQIRTIRNLGRLAIRNRVGYTALIMGGKCASARYEDTEALEADLAKVMPSQVTHSAHDVAWCISEGRGREARGAESIGGRGCDDLRHRQGMRGRGRGRDTGRGRGRRAWT